LSAIPVVLFVDVEALDVAGFAGAETIVFGSVASTPMAIS
jgi:hypothetical protein